MDEPRERFETDLQRTGGGGKFIRIFLFVQFHTKPVWQLFKGRFSIFFEKIKFNFLKWYLPGIRGVSIMFFGIFLNTI